MTPNDDTESSRGDPSVDRNPLLEDHPVAFRVALVLWALGAFLFIALAIPSMADVVQQVDDAVYELMIEWENGVFVAAAKALDFIGSSWVVTPIIVIVVVVLVVQRRWSDLVFWTTAMVASQLLIGPMKALYGRERPPMSLVETTGASFPSGHAVAGAAVAISLVILIVPAGPKRRNLELLAAGFAILMALSRVYLRAHWLSDVASGASLGAAAAVTAAAAVHWYTTTRSQGGSDESGVENSG